MPDDKTLGETLRPLTLNLLKNDLVPGMLGLSLAKQHGAGSGGWLEVGVTLLSGVPSMVITDSLYGAARN